MKARVASTLHLIDYLLLNQTELELCNLGLGGLTANDLTLLVSRLASTNNVAEAVYGWTTRLRSLLLEGAQTVSARVLADARHDMPTIDARLDRSDELLLSPSELLSARAWIWREGLYMRKSRVGFKYGPNVIKLVDRIYANTLWGRQKRDIPLELRVHEDRLSDRERTAVPVMTVKDDCALDRTISLYVRCLGNLNLLGKSGYAVPAQSVDLLLKKDLNSWVKVKEVGRFQTLPQDVVLGALQQSIVFALRYGEEIVKAYLAVAKEAAQLCCRISDVEVRRGLTGLVPQKLLDLGVRSWRIQIGAKGSGDYYERLRRNEGLAELVMILVGSIFIVTGAVTARRNGELTDLKVGNCLDKNERHLVFENRKSGVGETRQLEERPVPPLVVRLVHLLEELHALDRGAVDSKARGLFAYPSRTTGTLTDGSQNGVYFCVDLLCDYFELGGDSPETRYYLRQHQLRRFFAIAFFWGSGFGGLDTLRWFLGHSDPKQIWRYILESVPGKILTSVRSRYAAEALLSGNEAADALGDVVERRFGTREFSVLSEQELEEYLEVLLESSQLRVEPQFVEGDSGNSYRIAILVAESETADD